MSRVFDILCEIPSKMAERLFFKEPYKTGREAAPNHTVWRGLSERTRMKGYFSDYRDGKGSQPGVKSGFISQR